MEHSVFLFINHSFTRPELDRLMTVLSCWDLWRPFLLFACAAVLALGRFRDRAAIIVLLATVGLSDGVVVNSLKHLVGRPRPKESLEGTRSLDLAKARPRLLAIAMPLKIKTTKPENLCERGYSFPSGHAANTFAAATVLSLFYRRRGWIAYIPAGLVAYSRVYVGAHWPGDVLAGIVIGIAVAWIVTRSADRGWRNIGKKIFPVIAEAHPTLL